MCRSRSYAAERGVWSASTLFALNIGISKNMAIQSTLVISNSKGLTETLRDIRTSTYQSWDSEENDKLNNHI